MIYRANLSFKPIESVRHGESKNLFIQADSETKLVEKLNPFIKDWEVIDLKEVDMIVINPKIDNSVNLYSSIIEVKVGDDTQTKEYHVIAKNFIDALNILTDYLMINGGHMKELEVDETGIDFII